MLTTKAKLLIVDDDASLRRALSDLFTANGYSVRSAEEGSSALTKIEIEVPDIILSDLYMPGMSGFEFLSVVHFKFPTIHVIAMSGAFSGARVPPGVAADVFYAKGSSTRSLLQTVDAMTQSEPGLNPQRQSFVGAQLSPGGPALRGEMTGRGCISILQTLSHRRVRKYETAPAELLHQGARMGRAPYRKIAMYNIIGVGFWLTVVLFLWFIIYLASRLSG